METKLTEVQKLQATISHLCEESSEVVSDQIDPSVNVNWMRCSPDLPKYVRELEDRITNLEIQLDVAEKLLSKATPHPTFLSMEQMENWAKEFGEWWAERMARYK